MTQPTGQRDHGHRTVPHTADLRIEAWGRSREECVAEAVRGLVESFAEVSGVPGQRATRCHLTAGSAADLLAAAIDEVIYRLDADGVIPTAIEVRRAGDGGIDLTLRMVDVGAAEITGAVPKAASLSELTCAPAAAGAAGAAGGWSGAVTVDV